jgi:hypothetical protein
MNLNWRDFTLRDIVGLLAGVVAVAVWLGWWFVSGNAYGKADQNFGPDWVCANRYGKGAICIKKPPVAPAGPSRGLAQISD